MALQTAGIVSGLPYTMIVVLLCVSIWRAVKVASGDLDPNAPTFSIGLFDPIGAEPLQVLKTKPKAAFSLFLQFLKNIFLAPWTIAKAAHRLSGKKSGLWLYIMATVPCFALMIFFLFCELVISGCWAVGCFFYLLYVASLTGIRLEARQQLNIDGSIFEDFFSCLFFYACVAIQLDVASKSVKCVDVDDDVTELETKNNRQQPAFDSNSEV